jgi:hypothetical protein
VHNRIVTGTLTHPALRLTRNSANVILKSSHFDTFQSRHTRAHNIPRVFTDAESYKIQLRTEKAPRSI